MHSHRPLFLIPNKSITKATPPTFDESQTNGKWDINDQKSTEIYLENSLRPTEMLGSDFHAVYTPLAESTVAKLRRTRANIRRGRPSVLLVKYLNPADTGV